MQTPQTPTQQPQDTLWVACLCAGWCGACREYKPLFEQLQQEFAGAKFLWIDIEDEADLVDPIEVENFPTLLIASGATPGFFGTVTPHLDTLRRLIKTQLEAGGTPLPQAHEAWGLLQRLSLKAN
ncbi:MAG: hypothetical protein RLZZ573_1132 [Pseudomonadota bacterium]|jgi:thioredoxin 1